VQAKETSRLPLNFPLMLEITVLRMQAALVGYRPDKPSLTPDQPHTIFSNVAADCATLGVQTLKI